MVAMKSAALVVVGCVLFGDFDKDHSGKILLPAHIAGLRGHVFSIREKTLAGHNDGSIVDFDIVAIDGVFDGGFPAFALHEVRCSLTRDIGAATGFLAGLLAGCMQQRQGRIVWICDPACRLDGGQLFPAGLAMFGLDPARLVVVQPVDLKAALWAIHRHSAAGW